MFNNFTQDGGKSNRSVVLAARVIFMVFRIRDQDAIPNTYVHAGSTLPRCSEGLL